MIVEIGGNDVDSNSSPYDIALAKLNLAREILSLGVECVVLTTILPRDITRMVPKQEYRLKADETNQWTSRFLETDPQRQSLQFHHHKGFWRDDNQNEVDTTGWSTDGIHPDTPVGLGKLLRSFTRAVHNMVKTHRNAFCR